MLRAQLFLPCQLRAAYVIVQRRVEAGELTDGDLVTRLFGNAREFLPGARARTPLVNNITAAAAFVDQYGRLYAYADPSEPDDEDDLEPDAVPNVYLTDQLFVAIPNAQRHAEHADESAVPLEGLRLPEIDEQLMLRPYHAPGVPTMTVEVFSFLEPGDPNAPRVSSAFIQLNGLICVQRPGTATPQAILEALMQPH